MNEATLTAGVFFLGLAFGCGAYAMALRLATKQINGIGGRVNRIAAVVIHLAPPDQREEITLKVFGLLPENVPLGSPKKERL